MKILELRRINKTTNLLTMFFIAVSPTEDDGVYIEHNKNILFVEIEYLYRGINSYSEFGNFLKSKFPNIKELVMIQNYTCINKDDTWRTMEKFFVEMNLDYLEVDDDQRYYYEIWV